MPPKKNKKSSQEVEIESLSLDNDASMATAFSSLQEFFDERMKQ